MFNNPLSFIDPSGLTANNPNAIVIEDAEQIRQFWEWLANNWENNQDGNGSSGGGGPSIGGIWNYVGSNNLGNYGWFGYDSNGNPGIWVQYLTPISGQAYNSDHNFLGNYNNPYMVPRWAVANKFIGFNNLGALGNTANGEGDYWSIDHFLDNTTNLRDGSTIALRMVENATDSRIPGNNSKLQPRGFNPAAEAKVAKWMKVTNGVVGVAGRTLGVLSIAEHGNEAYKAFQSGDTWKGIGYSALTVLDFGLMFVKTTNPFVLAGVVTYSILDTTAF